MGIEDLAALRLLAKTATRIEGDALARLDTIGADELGELVVWAWVFDEDRTQVLLVDHHLFDMWVTPGGRAGRGEDPIAAVTRELLEETGLTGAPLTTSPALVDAIDRLDPDGRPVTTFGAAFVFHAEPTAPLSPEDGQPAQWWSLADPPRRRRAHLWDRVVAQSLTPAD
jgi:8-oxo-dGTP pyrophosphatase MutT (NUDIX family)